MNISILYSTGANECKNGKIWIHKFRQQETPLGPEIVMARESLYLDANSSKLNIDYW